jgi:hypothetical protein
MTESKESGKALNELLILLSAAEESPWCLPSIKVSINNPTNCVVKALVDATPISGPALVKNTKSDSLAKELEGTLQIPSLAKYPAPSAALKQASVSAVSPD